MTQVIGIDIGGTKINAVVTDNNGKVLHQHTIITPGKQGPQAVLKSIIELVNKMQKQAQEVIQAIGIGTPGYIDAKNGKVIYSSGVIRDWVDIPLHDILAQKFNLPIAVENDANVAAIGEGWLGAAQNMAQYMVVTLGTSVGGAYVNDKFGVLHGYGWRGGEIGHSILHPQGKKCLCGQYGCAELYLSGTAIVNRYRELGGTAVDGRDVFNAMAAENPTALIVKEEFINDFATLLISLQNILDPEAFIISGGLIHTRSFWWCNLKEALDKRSNKGVKIKILPAKLFNQAGALGAARIALAKLES